VTPPRLVHAVSLGPAAGPALADGGALRVDGVFPSTVNLEVVGAGAFVSLTGPAGEVFPHAVALAEAQDFPGWRLVVGAPVTVRGGLVALPAVDGELRISLAGARRPAPRPLPPIASPGRARDACERRLAELQAGAGAALRVDALRGAAPPPASSADAGLAVALARAAGALTAAREAAVPEAVAALVGLGPGLTPAGDDFLAGQLAAARAAGRGGRAAALGEAIARSLRRTTALSAFLLRCALRDLWPGPLLDLAASLAVDDEPAALAAVEALGALGHSSGLDLSTGFVVGLGDGAR
jgi:hypothetical protein